MNKTQLQTELDGNIPKNVIETREGGGGKQLSYLQGWYVIDRLNQVLGIGNWSYNVQALTKVYEGTVTNFSGKESFSTSYVANINLTAQLDGKVVSFSDVGYGDGSDPKNPGKAHELAVKEAVTDGIKRAAKNLGRSMGLALYDKEGQYVGTDKSSAVPAKTEAPKAETKAPPVAAPKSQAADTKATPALKATPKKLTETDLVKEAFNVLSKQGKITQEVFKVKYLEGKGLSTLNNQQLLTVIKKLKADFPALPL